jgi:hypothetical protein
MPELDRTAASLRFFGDDLDPDAISGLLGSQPTVAVTKGGVWQPKHGVEVKARTGSWRRHVERRSPGDLDGQIAELLAPLSRDLSVWKDLTTRFYADIFCGLFLEGHSGGIGLQPETMAMVGSRGLILSLDIYAGDE